MADWVREGTAHRTRVRRDPVRHLLVQDRPGEWVAMIVTRGDGIRVSSYDHGPGHQAAWASIRAEVQSA